MIQQEKEYAVAWIPPNPAAEMQVADAIFFTRARAESYAELLNDTSGGAAGHYEVVERQRT